MIGGSPGLTCSSSSRGGSSFIHLRESGHLWTGRHCDTHHRETRKGTNFRIQEHPGWRATPPHHAQPNEIVQWSPSVLVLPREKHVDGVVPCRRTSRLALQHASAALQGDVEAVFTWRHVFGRTGCCGRCLAQNEPLPRHSMRWGGFRAQCKYSIHGASWSGYEPN